MTTIILNENQVRRLFKTISDDKEMKTNKPKVKTIKKNEKKK